MHTLWIWINWFPFSLSFSPDARWPWRKITWLNQMGLGHRYNRFLMFAIVSKPTALFTTSCLAMWIYIMPKKAHSLRGFRLALNIWTPKAAYMVYFLLVSRIGQAAWQSLHVDWNLLEWAPTSMSITSLPQVQGTGWISEAMPIKLAGLSPLLP